MIESMNPAFQPISGCGSTLVPHRDEGISVIEGNIGKSNSSRSRNLLYSSYLYTAYGLHTDQSAI